MVLMMTLLIDAQEMLATLVMTESAYGHRLQQAAWLLYFAQR